MEVSSWENHLFLWAMATMAMSVYQRVAYFQHRNWVRVLRSSSAAGTDGLHCINQLLGIQQITGGWTSNGEHQGIPGYFLSHEIHEIQCNQQLQRWDAKIYLVGGFKHDFIDFQIEQTMIPKPFRKNNNWLVVWNIWIIFPNSWDDDPIWRTHIFQRDWNHQLAIVHWRTAKPVGPACFAARIPSLSGVGASPCRIFLISYTSSSWPAICFSAGLDRTSRLGDKGIHP